MAHNDEEAIAKVYARSLLELAVRQGDADLIDREFSEFAAYLKIDPDFKVFATSRVIDPDDRRESLDRMFRGRMNDLLLNALHVLNGNDRLELVAHVQQQFHELYLERQSIVEVQVTTAEPLGKPARLRLQALMADRTKLNVVLIEHVDPAVLGGVVVRVGDERIDVSVVRQLRRFHDALLDHAAQHIHSEKQLFEGATVY